jgi:hypothetical protein
MTESKKYKFNIINKDGREEPYTGIFRTENGLSGYERAVNWYTKFGVELEREGKVLVFREALKDGKTEEEELPID